MLLSILGFISGLAGPISSVINKISDLKIMQVKAASDFQRAEIDQQIQALHDRQAVLVAEAGNRVAAILNASMRFLLALPPLVVLWKILAWDKVVGAFYGCNGRGTGPECNIFITDSLDVNLWWVITAVIGFYFLVTWRK